MLLVAFIAFVLAGAVAIALGRTPGQRLGLLLVIAGVGLMIPDVLPALPVTFPFDDHRTIGLVMAGIGIVMCWFSRGGVKHR